jgi:hypothetical protein
MRKFESRFVRSSAEKKGWWQFLNSSFGLWFLSSISAAAIGTGWTYLHDSLERSAKSAERQEQLIGELTSRHEQFILNMTFVGSSGSDRSVLLILLNARDLTTPVLRKMKYSIQDARGLYLLFIGTPGSYRQFSIAPRFTEFEKVSTITLMAELSALSFKLRSYEIFQKANIGLLGIRLNGGELFDDRLELPITKFYEIASNVDLTHDWKTK